MLIRGGGWAAGQPVRQGSREIEVVALAYVWCLSAAPLRPPRKGRVGARPLHPRALGAPAESLAAPAAPLVAPPGFSGRRRHAPSVAATLAHIPVCSPGPASPLGNDFYAPTPSANHQVCKEKVGGDFWAFGGFTRFYCFMQQWALAPHHFYKPKICLEIAEDNPCRLSLSA